MQIGIGIDGRLGLTLDEERALVREATSLGYTSAWTPASATGRDAFHTCVQWWQASREIASGGLTVGISVVPVPTWSVVALASQAATVGELTGGRFILGVGPGGIQDPGFRRSYGLPDHPPVTLMREYVVTLRRLLDGETVDYEGRVVTLRGVRLALRPPPVPVYLAALGPQMLRLAGEVAEGVAPNWAGPEQIAWCREQVAAGARRAARDPQAVPVIQYIRVCVDEDIAAARRAFARQVLAYALARPGAPKTQGYRAHFARMGFDPVLTELEARRDAGASEAELADAMPDELLLRVGYFGRPDGAAAAFRKLAVGLDVAIVRIITARPTLDAALLAARACRPELVTGM